MNAFTDQGVRLVGRIARIVDGTAQFSGSLRNLGNLADLKMDRLLDTIDEWVHESGWRARSRRHIDLRRPG